MKTVVFWIIFAYSIFSLTICPLVMIPAMDFAFSDTYHQALRKTSEEESLLIIKTYHNSLISIFIHFGILNFLWVIFGTFLYFNSSFFSSKK